MLPDQAINNFIIRQLKAKVAEAMQLVDQLEQPQRRDDRSNLSDEDRAIAIFWDDPERYSKSWRALAHDAGIRLRMYGKKKRGRPQRFPKLRKMIEGYINYQMGVVRKGEKTSSGHCETAA